VEFPEAFSVEEREEREAALKVMTRAALNMALKAEARVAELEAKLDAKDRAHADVVAALEARICRLSGGN
jgi:hypothetical protein